MMKIFVWSLALFIAIPTTASAAYLYFGAPSRQVSTTNLVEVGVFLNDEGESINAVSGLITWQTEDFTFSQTLTAKSAVNLWVKSPELASGQANAVEFSGILPGGNQGYLFSVLLAPQRASAVQVSAKNIQAFLNDGRGTPVIVAVKPLTLQAVLGASSTPVTKNDPVVQTDKQPPLEFQIHIARSKQLFENKWFASFAATDLETGIDYYELQEGKRDAPEANAWVKQTSPYVLSDQSRQSYLFVKAVDKSGNERVIKMLPEQQDVHKWYSKSLFWFIILLLGAVIAKVIFSLRKKK